MCPEITPEYLASQGLSISFPQRFFSKVQKTDGCWLWTGSKSRNGYGNIHRIGHKGGIISSHVASFILHYGPIPNGLFVLHKCDVAGCVRPDHLWLGTQSDNIKDCISKGRIAYGIKNGRAKLSEENVEEILETLKNHQRGDAEMLARKFKVSHALISFIKHGKLWFHISKPSLQTVLSESAKHEA